tara:strand:+ start:1719 stop:2690 length:972 start_codon:yes stop_codon:yes gene_type:complete
MSKIKIGIIGAGGISSAVHLPLLSCMEDVKIEFLADTRNPTTLAESYDTTPIQIKNISSLPECDVALLAIPVGVKEDYIKEFSKRDCYIFTEKPFALNLETHQSFLNMTNKITCNYMRTYYNTTHQIKDIISSNLLGPIKEMTVTEGGIIGKTGRGKDSYQSDPKLSGGGFLAESACHTFSQLDFLFNDITLDNATVIWEDNFDVESNATLNVNDKNSFKINYTGTMIKHVEPSTTIIFENNKLQYNHLDPESTFILSSLTSDTELTLEKQNYFASNFAQAYYLKWKDFLRKISDSQELNVNKETSIMTTKLINDIIESGGKK